MNKTKTEFKDDELLMYMKLPAKEKLMHLERMNRFLRKVKPLKSWKISRQLAKEGF
jgi:hypothetical protein